MKHLILAILIYTLASGLNPARSAAQEASPTPQTIGGGVEILWYQEYPDDFSPKVLGEMRNTTGQRIHTPALWLAFTNDEGDVYGSSHATPLIPVLDAGQTVGFEAYMSDVADGWTNATISACTWSFDFDEAATNQLTIEEFTAEQTGEGRFNLSGWVRNHGESEVPFITVVIEAKDPNSGRFIGWTHASIDATVPAGRRGAFSYFIVPADMLGWTPGTVPEFILHPLVSSLSGSGQGC